MGLDYAFVYVAPRRRATSLLRAIASRVSRPYATRIRAALPFAPEGDEPHCGVRGLPPFQVGGTVFPRSYDLAFVYPLDEALERYLGAELKGRSEEGKARIGLVYMTVHAGETWVQIALGAATTDMSALLATSSSVRRVMRGIARRSRSAAAFLDCEEDDTWDLIHPLGRYEWVRRVPRAPGRRFFGPFATRAEVDDFCAQSLVLAGVPPAPKEEPPPRGGGG